MSEPQIKSRKAATEKVYTILRELPWWAVIIAIVGVVVAFSVLTDVRYQDAMYFVFDLPWDRQLLGERPVQGDTWTYTPDPQVSLSPGLYRIYAEFNAATGEVKDETDLFSEPNAKSAVLGKVPAAERVTYLKWHIIPKSGMTLQQTWVNVRAADGREGWLQDKSLAGQTLEKVGQSDFYLLEIAEGAKPVAAEPITGPTTEMVRLETTLPELSGPVPAGAVVRIVNKYDLKQTLKRAWTSKGVMLTLRATLMGFGLALILGLIAGLMLVSRNPITLAISKLYVEVVRGIPLLVIILYAGFVVSPYLREATDGKLDLSGLPGAVIGLGFGYGAYLAEVFRGGIQSIHHGQMEAARSLGMSYFQAMRHIILPQAFRVVLPPLGNDFMAMLKDSSLISVIALPEILQQGRLWVSRTFRAFEGYNTVALFYLVMTLLLSLLVRYIERKTSLPGHSED